MVIHGAFLLGITLCKTWEDINATRLQILYFWIMQEGRPTKYQTKYNKQGFKLCLLGATDEELADFFEVAYDTIQEWKTKHPKFSDSINAGKRKADSEVASKLFSRAIGYKYDEVTFEKEGSKENIELTSDGELKKTDTYKKKVVTKELPPDTTAQIFWLKNRQKAYWRDKQEVGVTDKNGEDVEWNITLNVGST